MQLAVAKRALIIGLDAASPTVLERFLNEGCLPHMGKLYQRGAYSKLLPVIPAQTPSNWVTIATGATPGTHGVVTWGTHIPGEPLMETHSEQAFCSGICRAEYLWEAAARAGRYSVVVYYPGYPPTTDMAIYIDWLYSPGLFFFELAPAECYTVGIVDKDAHARRWQTVLEVGQATDWSVTTSSSSLPPLEVAIPIVPHDGEKQLYYGLITGNGNGYNQLGLYRSKRDDKSILQLRAGEWSDWLHETFIIRGERKCGSVRFKLIELSPNGKRMLLYRSQVYPVDGSFTTPQHIGAELVQRFGPYVNEGIIPFWVHGLVDEATMRQEMTYQAKWLANAIAYVMEAYDAVLMIQHWHPIDHLGHTLVPKLDPNAHDYDQEHADECWSMLRTVYEVADQLVGEIISRFDMGETAVIIASDHGMPPNRKAVSLFNLFRQHGLVAVKEAEDGRLVPDWANSRVFYSQNHLWVNLQGREPNGIVPVDEYEQTVQLVLKLLRGLTDPDTGEHVIAIALRREDAPLIGLSGQHIGDVVFVYEGGYRWTGAEVLQLNEERIVFPSGGANHGPQLPTYETDVSSNYGILLMAGAGIRSNYVRDCKRFRAPCTTDIAPTVAYLTGIPTPAQSEGAVLFDMLVDAPPAPHRELQPLPWHIHPRRPKRVTLAGDVTDEM